MIRSILFLILILLLPASTFALEPMTVNASGDLHITVFITDSPKFIREWVETPPSHGPTIKRIKEAKYNQMVHAGFAVTGFTKDKDSKVNFVVGVQVKAPDGTILMQDNEWAKHNKKVIIDKGIIIADPVLDMTFEPSDPSGNYKVSAIVIDNLNGQRASGSAILKIK